MDWLRGSQRRQVQDNEDGINRYHCGELASALTNNTPTIDQSAGHTTNIQQPASTTTRQCGYIVGQCHRLRSNNAPSLCPSGVVLAMHQAALVQIILLCCSQNTCIHSSNKHGTITQCCLKVEPASKTLGQH